ncbi:Solute-binding protein family 5 domain-containing protein OS=Streptomyces microflavus OX=1919 GN=Smic_76040 PE=3 SV=1 [Streptomyces microflavus]
MRRALDVAVDRQTMVDAILNGSGKPAYGPVPTDSEWFTEGTERKHDLAAAKKILDEGGMEAGQGRRPRQGRRARHLPPLVPQR